LKTRGAKFQEVLKSAGLKPWNIKNQQGPARASRANREEIESPPLKRQQNQALLRYSIEAAV